MARPRKPTLYTRRYSVAPTPPWPGSVRGEHRRQTPRHPVPATPASQSLGQNHADSTSTGYVCGLSWGVRHVDIGFPTWPRHSRQNWLSPHRHGRNGFGRSGWADRRAGHLFPGFYTRAFHLPASAIRNSGGRRHLSDSLQPPCLFDCEISTSFF